MKKNSIFRPVVLEETLLHTDKASVGLSVHGHIVIRINENADLEENDIAEINALKSRFAGGQLHTVLFIAPIVGSMSDAARKLSASKAVNHKAVAKAIVAQSLATNLISNFFIRINKPPAPTRVFRCENQALAWLSEMRRKHS